MDRYVIYCTEDQTRKALELDAPLKFTEEGRGVPEHCIYMPRKWGYYTVPTAEQMIGWLRTKGFRFKINESEDITTWQIKDGWRYHGECATPGEAYLAAIDAALDYLKKTE